MLDSALIFLQEGAADHVPGEVHVCTGSQSTLGRLREGLTAQGDVLAEGVWRRLREVADRGTNLSLQWVPGQESLPGNGLADEVGRTAADMDKDQAPVDLQPASARLRRHAQGEWEERVQQTRYFQEVGPRRAVSGERLDLSRRASRRQGCTLVTRRYWPDAGIGSASRKTQPARGGVKRPRHSATSYNAAPI